MILTLSILSDESLQGCLSTKMNDKRINEMYGSKLFEENNVGVVAFHLSVADGNLGCVRQIANTAREKRAIKWNPEFKRFRRKNSPS